MQARREAMAADLVVVNHHLFFADMALRDSGVAELLPTVDAAVFDEAHQLVEAGVQFLGTTLGTGAGCIDFARDLLAVGLQQARGLRAGRPAGRHAASARRASCAWPCAGPLREVRGMIKLRWDERAATDDWAAGLQAVADAALAVRRGAGRASPPVGPDFAKLEQRAPDGRRSWPALFVQPAAADQVRWIDVSPQQARLVESPLDIREMLSEQRALAPKAWIFTSATLGDDERLSWFTAATGLEDARDAARRQPLRLRRARPLLGAGALSQAQRQPATRRPSARWRRAVRGRCGGRTFVLTTTLRVLPLIAEALRQALRRATASRCEVLVQGSAAQARAAAALRRRPRLRAGRLAELLGRHRRARRCAAVRADRQAAVSAAERPAGARRGCKQIEARGRNAFADYFVAEAAVSLKQGAGRLIRSETDRGLLVVCDPRLRQMNYGRAPARGACRRWRELSTSEAEALGAGWPSWRPPH